MQIAIVIPTYNEAENIERLIHSILRPNFAKASLGKLKLIVVDDNSPDGTGNKVKKLANKYKNKIILISRPGKLGLGTAYITGFKKALEEGSDVIITMDADFSHDPLVIPKFLKLLKSSDLVIGSRYVKGGKIIGFDLGRILLSKFAQASCNYIVGIKIKDSTSAFRAYRKNVLKKIDFEKIKSDGYSFMIEVIYNAQRKNIKIKELPITYINRREGKSKVSESEIYKGLVTILRLGTKKYFS